MILKSIILDLPLNCDKSSASAGRHVRLACCFRCCRRVPCCCLVACLFQLVQRCSMLFCCCWLSFLCGAKRGGVYYCSPLCNVAIYEMISWKANGAKLAHRAELGAKLAACLLSVALKRSLGTSGSPNGCSCSFRGTVFQIAYRVGGLWL